MKEHEKTSGRMSSSICDKNDYEEFTRIFFDYLAILCLTILTLEHFDDLLAPLLCKLFIDKMLDDDANNC